MITAGDLDDAVRAGVLNREQARALSEHVAARHRETSGTDEERFRLITGFNDVFVVIACALVLIPAAWLVAAANKPFSAASSAYAGLAVSAVAWMLAEVFVRKRRMAVPAIALTLAFLGGLQVAAGSAFSRFAMSTPAVALYLVLALVSMVVDRRALMVSAQGYVLVALVTALKGGALGTNLAVPLVALIVGSALLLLSAFWGQALSALLLWVPGGVREWLPSARMA